jgi:hypothetical protein
MLRVAFCEFEVGEIMSFGLIANVQVCPFTIPVERDADRSPNPKVFLFLTGGRPPNSKVERTDRPNQAFSPAQKSIQRIQP